MFKKRKNKFIILISSLSIISLFSIVLGSFIIVNEANITLNMTPNYGVVSNNIEGISISGNTSLSMGKYFYYENNSSVKEGTLSYLINVNPSKLSNDLKVSNDNGGYSFTLLGSLEINNLEIFNDNTYAISSKLNEEDVSLSYDGYLLSFNLNIKTNTTSETIEIFNLSFKFSNKLILDYKNDLIDKSFTLKVNV